MSVFSGSGDPPIDPSQKSHWGVVDIAGQAWLEREVVKLERQVAAGEGIVHQFCTLALERLGPFEDMPTAQTYLDAMEGR
jgi:hypothetical protein